MDAPKTFREPQRLGEGAADNNRLRERTTPLNKVVCQTHHPDLNKVCCSTTHPDLNKAVRQTHHPDFEL